MEDKLRFIDIHSHILPEIDDGARDFEESLLMMNEVREAGGKGIVLTPHVAIDGSETKILDKIGHQYDLLNRLALERGIAVDLYLGAELMLHPELPQRIKGDKRLTVNRKGKYVLIEMPFFEIPFYAPSIFFNLLACGITPIWAHPERCPEVIDDFNSVRAYTGNGVKLQINSGSLAGIYGRKIKRAAIMLFENGLGHILASDTHSPDEMEKSLSRGYSSIVKIAGKEKALEICEKMPSRITGTKKGR